jgi:hypothetical protein
VPRPSLNPDAEGVEFGELGDMDSMANHIQVNTAYVRPGADYRHLIGRVITPSSEITSRVEPRLPRW